jgi:ketosteroid isomerase-like protein
MSEAEATVRAYFDGINAERYDDVGALFAPDGVLVAPGTPPRRGPQEVADYFRAALRLYPEHCDDPTRVIVAGGTVTVEIHYTGALENGERIEFDAIDVFDLDGEGRIVRLSSWYDSHAVRRALRAALERDGRTAAR